MVQKKGKGEKQKGDVLQLQKKREDELTPAQKRAMAYVNSQIAVARDIEKLFQNIVFDVSLISGLKDETVFNEDFWRLAITESLDALAIALPEQYEAAVIIMSKIIKIASETQKRVSDAKKGNNEILSFYSDYTATREAQSKVIMELEAQKAVIRNDPDSIYVLMYSDKTPQVKIRQQALPVVKALETAQYLSMLKRKGAKVIYQFTDSGSFETGQKYEDTKHYKTAVKRHNDPYDNFYLPYYGNAGYTQKTGYVWRTICVLDSL